MATQLQQRKQKKKRGKESVSECVGEYVRCVSKGEAGSKYIQDIQNIFILYSREAGKWIILNECGVGFVMQFLSMLQQVYPYACPSVSLRILFLFLFSYSHFFVIYIFISNGLFALVVSHRHVLVNELRIYFCHSFVHIHLCCPLILSAFNITTMLCLFDTFCLLIGSFSHFEHFFTLSCCIGHRCMVLCAINME